MNVPMITALYIFVIFLLVIANGFFVASEFALVGVRRTRIAMLAEAGNQRAKLLLELVDNLNAYISATQLGITMASLALGWIGEPVFAHLLEAPLEGRVSDAVRHTVAFAIAFSVITFLHIVLGELAPKTLALERAEKVALAIAGRCGSSISFFVGRSACSIGPARGPYDSSAFTLHLNTLRSIPRKNYAT
jgi:magnesium and cobalt exporter, CNNM family